MNLPTPEQARKLEALNDWEGARDMWKLCGFPDQARTCQYIIDANRIGDEYRAEVLRVAGPEPEVVGPKEDSIKWMQWQKKMSEVYTRMFGTSTHKA
jgi:hypothetical protein